MYMEVVFTVNFVLACFDHYYVLKLILAYLPVCHVTDFICWCILFCFAVVKVLLQKLPLLHPVLLDNLPFY